MTHAACRIDGEPFLVASMPWAALRPGLAAVCRAPHIIAEKGLSLVRLETEIEKFPVSSRLCHRVAAEDVIFQNTGERPRRSAVGRISPAGLPEVGVNAIELPPGDHHLVAIRRINRNGRLVRASPRILLPFASTFAWKLVNTPNCEIMRGEVSIFRGGAGGMLYFSSGSFSGSLRMGASVCRRSASKGER